MTNKITIRLLSNTSDFEDIKSDWDNLFLKSSTQSVFLSWEWLYSWWRVNQGGKKLWLITSWCGSELTGIAPLMVEKRNGILKVLTNIGTPQSDVGGILHHRDDKIAIDHIIDYIILHKNGWHMVELNEVDKSWLDNYNIYSNFRNNNLRVLEDINEHYYIQLDNDWNDFSTRLAKKFRYNLRRALRLAEEIGTVELRHFKGNQVSWEVFKTILEINRYANFPRLYNSENEQALIREIINRMSAGKNYLDVYILVLNDQPIAYEYGFVNNGRFEDWRSGFDTRLPQHISIGKLLAMKVVQKCISQNYSEIDFLRGDEAYKLEWQPADRSFSRVRIFNNNIPGLISHFWLTKLKPVLKRNQAAKHQSNPDEMSNDQ